MLQKIRNRAQDEQGFTLIELLVVILIIAILAAVAIPTFLNQRGKAYDSNAQSLVKNMQTAQETYATSNNGTYATTLAQLNGVDASIPTADANGVNPSVTGNGTTGYTVSASADNTGDQYSIVETSGAQQNVCQKGTGGGSPGGCANGSTW